MIEGEELDDVQQSSPVEPTPAEPEAKAAEGEAQQPVPESEVKDDAKEPNPLDPEGSRFKQVWARAKAAEAKAAQVEAEARAEREERIRLEERLAAKEAAKAEAQPKYTWDQLQAAVDAGQITMGKALEIRDQQLYDRWEKDQQAREQKHRVLSDVSVEMNEYKRLVPNASVPGTDERQKVEREYGYLVKRLGEPTSREQALSMELAAARAAFGDLDTLKTKQTLASKPLPKESYMETSGSKKQMQDTKKDFRSTLTSREVQHYERMMRQGRYPGGWSEVQKEHEEYEKSKALA